MYPEHMDVSSYTEDERTHSSVAMFALAKTRGNKVSVVNQNIG